MNLMSAVCRERKLNIFCIINCHQKTDIHVDVDVDPFCKERYAL